jgi:hypothetical protein
VDVLSTGSTATEAALRVMLQKCAPWVEVQAPLANWEEAQRLRTQGIHRFRAQEPAALVAAWKAAQEAAAANAENLPGNPSAV